MAAATQDLLIEQGATFTLGFTWYDGDPNDGGTPHDLTGCTARMQIRRRQGDPVIVQATSAEPDTPEAIADGAGRITIDGPEGHVRITLTDSDTDKLTVRSARYDLEVEWPKGDSELRPRVDRLLEGAVTVSPNVTQEAG